ncbi:MAG: DUF354 domain-containing protein [Candidatus Bathyarchaeota archaeon]|nr:MAG: DUF354 domain-containing protein [Candidatus Bathyarchaeota archaeon]
MTPKQIFFLGELGRRLEAKGHNVFRTTRRFREVDTLIELTNINALFVGKYGGATLEGKLAASAQRIERLSYIISRLKPDISISFSSPDAARTAFGLGIPHYIINDSPHSHFVARLTIPLSVKLFSPSIISKNVWLQLGATLDQLIQYHALDPVAWLKTFTPNPEVLNELNLDPTRPIVALRIEESFASYLLGYTQLEEPAILPIINKLLDKYGDTLQIVALPRYDEQIPIVKAAYNDSIIVPEKTVDGPSLLFFTSIFIGAGGTMTAESALMGKPTISCYPREPTIVEKYLIEKKLIHRETNPEKISKIIDQILRNYENISIKQQKLASALLSSMEDPLDIIINTVETDYQSNQTLT